MTKRETQNAKIETRNSITDSVFCFSLFEFRPSSVDFRLP
jgi:hypothetical protein